MSIEELRRLVEEQLLLSRRLKARVRDLEAEAHAPVAVVGMALRFPGGITTPEQYWDFLQGEKDALSDIPAERVGLRRVYDARPDQPGRSYVNRAGFLDQVAEFDAKFFGISKREAEALDPQQRLLLETSWEAMERAGLAVRRNDRLNAGVFVGIMASEYGERRLGQADKTDIDPYFGTGGGHCFAAGRVSYVMGFSGPAMSVDTACSSSLVALHLANQSLRRRECRYAVVGGANMLFSGDLMVSLCRSGALAPDGRSKTFTARADGYGRGEGVGCIVLMRLDDAERERRPILAVLRGTATNHDGASSGLTVPSGPAQREVLQAALTDAGVRPDEIGYVEAHGTGTALGDPIEVNALDATLGTGAAGRKAPLSIGNVKTRIGHLEAAAGIAGVIKVILTLQHREIPRALRASDGPLNPLVPWDRMAIDVPRQAQAWPSVYARRLAGVSAFGLSGTNAHVIFESHDAVAMTPAVPSLRPELVTLSARDPESLREMVRGMTRHLASCDDAELSSIAHTLRTGRTRFGCRIAVIGRTKRELLAAIETAVKDTVPGANAPAVTLQLRIRRDEQMLASGVAELLRAYPLLAPTNDQPRDAGQTLQEILRKLGLRTKIETVALPSDTVAQLTWNTGSYPLVAADAGLSPAFLLSALAGLFVAGFDLQFDALCAADARFAGDLPTYPFRRERFWIDELDETPDTPEVQPGSEEGGNGQRRLEQDNVVAYIDAELKELLRAEGALDRSVSFLDVGGDSFIAMLLKKTIERRFDLELPQDLFAPDVPLATLYAQVCDHILAAPAPLVIEDAA